VWVLEDSAKVRLKKRGADVNVLPIASLRVGEDILD
jgi:hypothetical protein